MFDGKVLMITGGTGSFGHTVLKRFIETEVKEIRIFSRDEKKQEDMRIALGCDKVKFYIGDVRDYDSLSQAMTGVDYVFHAAALKQVPSCEFYPMEAVRTNVLGTENMLNAAIAKGVSRVVVLSTDKAVYPINAMGISKAMAEKLMVAKSRTIPEGGTVVCATRYGNVMASRGSVIPLFIQQLLDGQEITVTDPSMTRFLMSLEESVDLVLHAFEHGQQGDIFIQKAPASTVADLAQALKELLNKTNPIKIIGTRHGEKLYESLVSREEMAKAEDMGQYFRIPADNRDLNYAKYFVEGEQRISEFDDYTSHNTHRLDIPGVKEVLKKLDYVQEFLNA
ncbi:MAG: polysaccharide biosynthesis protein [Gammaproteobacteria bacterium]|uniref:polysaccharide biosynthesis protein n=1 Tax=Limnobacter sp. TaxID=2003368 RepID=UPI001D4A97FD|nr:polysaccharide biosynthesis protein [Gammaproteobacteria bacterium]MBU0848575.1 polysaccharide biosynthesis protein [Gammaproteobacteria bacterium]MBU1267288.1 polysaccharide biosynthesis protein [Gammaproteobacteria bacterium]MBU1530313.1 polysaccharide biosynthesis protein [Gammaproteobacteria bacterium]MBU1780216.1 polysaccharide biosynthesis protein [Gammaproteobacteria bacterium]